jgi:hypothetical protein
MGNSTGKTERDKSVQVLLGHGFRITFSNENMTCLYKGASDSTLHIAQVRDDGSVNTEPLSEFLERVLDGK